jgi:hypothetical protein
MARQCVYKSFTHSRLMKQKSEVIERTVVAQD